MPKIAPHGFVNATQRNIVLSMVHVLMNYSNLGDKSHPGCRAAAWVKQAGTGTDHLLLSYSTFKHGHAEEVLAIGMAKVFQTWNLPPVQCLYVDLEPCHSNKYPGHCCSKLVNGGGRTIDYHGQKGNVELQCGVVFWALDQGEVPDKPLKQLKLGVGEGDTDLACRLAGTTQADMQFKIGEMTDFLKGMWTHIWVIEQSSEGAVHTRQVK